ncbi:hypothetical protein DFH09DRAFT_1178859 [Mycena vulgaris]|nr:hypothetical protein DFH09DRAFT_1178859 [Mycena vulgaris]
MIAFVPLAIALLHTVAASPIAIGVNPTVVVYVTADTCVPTGSGGFLPSAVPISSAVVGAGSAVSSAVSSVTGLAGGAASSVLSVAGVVPTVVSSATGFVGGAASSLFSVASGVPSIASSATGVVGGDVSSLVTSATGIVGGAASSVVSAASAVVTGIPSFVSSALAAASSSAAAVDASVVSAVTSTQTTSVGLVTAVNTLVNTILLISKGLAANNIPASLVTAVVQNTMAFTTSTRALTDIIASGVAQATSAYLSSSVLSIAANLNAVTTQLQHLKSAGTLFNSQFLNSLGASQTSLQAFGTSLAGNYNAAAFLSALTDFNTALSALNKA